VDAFSMKTLLATDGSADAILAAGAAVDLSSKTHSELHVVHAWQAIPPYAYPSMTAEWYVPPYEEAARKLLAGQVKRVEEAGSVVTEAHLVRGRPADAIVDLGEGMGADLIVVGSRGLGAVGRLLVGSVSEGIVHHAPCPVLVVRGEQGSWPPERVVVADDGSEPAKMAGGLGVLFARLFGTEAVLVRSYENPPQPIGGWSAQDRRKLDESLLREERDLEEWAKELEAVEGKRPETRLVETEPTLALLLVAEEKEEEKTLIVVGSRGLGAAKRAMLGSVSTKVLKVARGPVLVVCPHVNEPEDEVAGDSR
jgi:nucleotide-binding universal stress UspA family protein